MTITIYDVTGRAVRMLIDEDRPAGRYSAVWDGTDDRGNPVGSGVYFYRLRAGKKVLAEKMLLVK